MTGTVLLLSMVGCGRPPSPAASPQSASSAPSSQPQQRQPVQPNFQIQAQMLDVSGRRFTLSLDTESKNVRLQEGQLAYLFKLGPVQPVKVLFLDHKQFFNYDTGRASHWPPESRVARQARFDEIARKCRLQDLQSRVAGLLEHPCQLAIRFWGSHPPCEHQLDANGLEHWTHRVVRSGNRQTSFKGWTESLNHEYDPRRGLVLAWDFRGLNQASGCNLQPQKESCEASAFEIPGDFQEAYSDQQMQDLLLPGLGEQHYSEGPPWRAAENYQDQYSDGIYTRERWVWGGRENWELQIDRLLVGPGLNLQDPSVLQGYCKEHRIQSAFCKPAQANVWVERRPHLIFSLSAYPHDVSKFDAQPIFEKIRQKEMREVFRPGPALPFDEPSSQSNKL